MPVKVLPATGALLAVDAEQFNALIDGIAGGLLVSFFLHDKLRMKKEKRRIKFFISNNCQRSATAIKILNAAQSQELA